jgi:threonine/homoserine/homoserine lactone efflux protein
MAPELELPLRGVAAGLIIAAPVGPVNVFCLQKTLENGSKAGILSGLGAALADMLYGTVAGFGISLVIRFLIGEEFWIRLVGGIALMVVGAVYYRKPPVSLNGGPKCDDASVHSDLVSAFLLTAANPTTVLSFLAVLASLGLGSGRATWQTCLLIAGIFSGSMMWWLILVSAASLLRDRVNESVMRGMNRVAGVAIGCFGLVNVVLSRGYRH